MQRKTLNRRNVTRLDNELAEKLRKRATKEGVTESQIVRRSLRAYLEATS